MQPSTQRVQVIDSHTAGEPTRVVIAGAPDLGDGSLAERLDRFRSRHDEFRSAVVNEPRGSEIIVGALLVKPLDPGSTAGVIFFNNVGYLGMCGHGAIGVIATLAHRCEIGPGEHRLETPVGTVRAWLAPSGEVTVENVPSYRKERQVTVEVSGHGKNTGDVAWGGNWFFLVERHAQTLEPANVEALTEFTWAIRQALARAGITGDQGREIDHIELFGPATRPGAHSRNFVLCPGKVYDRSPCGTGTSAKLACLAADGKLGEGEIWRQEGILGTVFEASYRRAGREIVPSIRGCAYVTGEATLILDPRDPFCTGIRR